MDNEGDEFRVEGFSAFMMMREIPTGSKQPMVSGEEIFRRESPCRDADIMDGEQLFEGTVFESEKGNDQD